MRTPKIYYCLGVNDHGIWHFLKDREAIQFKHQISSYSLIHLLHISIYHSPNMLTGWFNHLRDIPAPKNLGEKGYY